MRIQLVPIIVGLLVATISQAADGIPPFQSREDIQRITAKEMQLWERAASKDQVLVQSGEIYSSQPLTAYVQSVANKLFPEIAGAITIRLLKNAELNAFSLANGIIYINTGLLEQFDNEAQLASVIAHEGTHFINRHAFILASSNEARPSNLENEADEGGVRRLARAGYDPREAVKALEYLAAGKKESDAEGKLFFLAHPTVGRRIARIGTWIADSPSGGEIFQELYLQNTRELKSSAQ